MGPSPPGRICVAPLAPLAFSAWKTSRAPTAPPWHPSLVGALQPLAALCPPRRGNEFAPVQRRHDAGREVIVQAVDRFVPAGAAQAQAQSFGGPEIGPGDGRAFDFFENVAGQ